MKYLLIFIVVLDFMSPIPHLPNCPQWSQNLIEASIVHRNDILSTFLHKNLSEQRKYMPFYVYIPIKGKKTLIYIQPASADNGWSEQNKQISIISSLKKTHKVLIPSKCFESDAFSIFFYTFSGDNLADLLIRKQETIFLSRMNLYSEFLRTLDILINNSYGFMNINYEEIFHEAKSQDKVKFIRLSSAIPCEHNGAQSSSDAIVPLMSCQQVTRNTISAFLDGLLAHELNIFSSLRDKIQPFANPRESSRQYYNNIVNQIRDKARTNPAAHFLLRLFSQVGQHLLETTIEATPLTMTKFLSLFESEVTAISKPPSQSTQMDYVTNI